MKKTRSFSEKKIGFDDSFDVTKCLQQIEMPDLLHVCAQWNEQPSNIKTMGISVLRFKSASLLSNQYIWIDLALLKSSQVTPSEISTQFPQKLNTLEITISSSRRKIGVEKCQNCVFKPFKYDYLFIFKNKFYLKLAGLHSFK